MSKIAIQLKNTDDSSIYPITDSRIVYHGEERLSEIVEDTSTHISAIDSSIADIDTHVSGIDSSIAMIDSSIAGITDRHYNDFLNVNELNNNSTPYETISTARNAVGNSYRVPGLCITYMYNDTSTWIQEQFIGDSSMNWSMDANWRNRGSEIDDLVSFDELVKSKNVKGLLYALNQFAAGAGSFDYSDENGFVYTPANE